MYGRLAGTAERHVTHIQAPTVTVWASRRHGEKQRFVYLMANTRGDLSNLPFRDIVKVSHATSFSVHCHVTCHVI